MYIIKWTINYLVKLKLYYMEYIFPASDVPYNS